MTTPAERVTPQPRRGWIPPWTFADKLRKVRTALELQQRDFAALLEVGAPAYAAWESGRTIPRNQVAIARRIELVSGVPATWLLDLDGEPPTSEWAPWGSNPRPAD